MPREDKAAVGTESSSTASGDTRPAIGGPTPVDAATAAAPAGATSTTGSVNPGVLRSDQVRVMRELAPHREVQRLAVDLDGARISVRVDGDNAQLRVLADPGERLGGTWANDVQRSLNAVLRQQPSTPGQQHADPHAQQRNRRPYEAAAAAATDADEEFAGRLDQATGV